MVIRNIYDMMSTWIFGQMNKPVRILESGILLTANNFTDYTKTKTSERSYYNVARDLVSKREAVIVVDKKTMDGVIDHFHDTLRAR